MVPAKGSVSRGGFYAWLTRPRGRRSRTDKELGAKVRASFLGSRAGMEGPCCRRCFQWLAPDRAFDAIAGPESNPRRRRLPPDIGERLASAVAPNVLDRGFEAAAPNRKWIADFTYVWTAEGWLYEVAIIDLFSRRAVGWSMSAGMTAQLVTDDLVMAIWRRGKPDALLQSTTASSAR